MFDIFVRWRIDDPWACSDVWCVMADDRDAAHVLVISTVLALSCCLDSFLVYYHTCPSWKRKKGRANTRMYSAGRRRFLIYTRNESKLVRINR
jgi:hypothetical protein